MPARLQLSIAVLTLALCLVGNALAFTAAPAVQKNAASLLCPADRRRFTLSPSPSSFPRGGGGGGGLFAPRGRAARTVVAAGPAILEPPPAVKEDDVVVIEKDRDAQQQQQQRQHKRGGWAVRLFNDPMNKREFVAMLLSKIVGLTDGQAYQVMMQAHQNGVAVVGRYDLERAELYKTALLSNGLTSDMVPVEDD